MTSKAFNLLSYKTFVKNILIYQYIYIYIYFNARSLIGIKNNWEYEKNK